MSPHIMHVSQPTEGGVARCVVDFAKAQHAAGDQVTVVCPSGGSLIRDLRAAGVPTVFWSAGRSPGPATAVETRSLARLLAALRPDLLHLHSAKAGLSGRLVVRGRLPTVFQPHAWSFDAVRGPVAAAAVRWERLAARWTGALVCVSEAERARGEHERIRAPYRVVPNGVDLRALPVATAGERSAARARLGYGDEPLAVCIGRLSRQKGQDVLLDAWPSVLAAVPTARLVFVGDGPEAGRLTAQRITAVDLIGRSDDVSGWLAAADVVVVPSRWEGMALVPLEALARGRSVVASDVTGIRESVPAGCGAVVPAENPARLAEALAMRLANHSLAHREGQAGRRHVEAAHDVRMTTSLMQAVYSELLG